ncbi:MAG: TonB-dependent receptor, partial [Salinivenus sp.]
RLRPAVDEEGNHRAWSTSVFRPNPYFGQSQLERNDQRRQVRGFATARYSFTEGISLQARVGTDWYTLDATRATPSGTPWNTDGGISESTTRRREDNFDALFQFDQNLTESLTLDATLGGNVRYTTSENVSASGSDFILPNLVTLGNTRGDKQGGGYNFSEQQVNSLFGTAQFGYNNSLFVEVTGRNDWSSTLPADNNSYFYPSVSSSFIFSDVFDLPDVISFGKLRASAGRVGGDTGPYQLDVTYGLIGSHPSRTGGTVSRGALQQGTIPPLNLKPQEKETIEVGTNLQFFDDRLGLDVTWYRENSFNQILNVSISNTTGFGSRRINAGNIRNQGLELQLRGAILQSSAYSWRSRMNFSRNVNEVVELAENIESFGLGSSRSQRTSIQARVGEPYGQIVGPSFKRTEDGEIIHNPDGLPVVGDNEPLGNQEPSWTAGFTNTFRWQNLTLEALIDVSWGADLYSFTNAQAYGTGRHEDTLPGRDAGSVIGNGVKQATDENGNVVEGEYVENDVKVDPQDYYGFIAGNLDEPFVYDASYVRLRSLRLGYTLPGSLLEALPGLSSARVSVIGRNLWLIHDEVPNVDPSGGYSTGTDHGLEHASLPATRTFGVDVNLRF